MNPQSPRPAADIIQAILRNLEWAASIANEAADGAARSQDFAGMARHEASGNAYSEAITIIKSEAASLLTVTP